MSPKLQFRLFGMSWRLENFPTCPSPDTRAPAACMMPLLFQVSQTDPWPATIVGWSTDEPFGLGSRSFSPPPGFSPSSSSSSSLPASVAAHRVGSRGRRVRAQHLEHAGTSRPPSVLIATGMAPESSRSSHAMKRLP